MKKYYYYAFITDKGHSWGIQWQWFFKPFDFANAYLCTIEDKKVGMVVLLNRCRLTKKDYLSLKRQVEKRSLIGVTE